MQTRPRLFSPPRLVRAQLVALGFLRPEPLQPLEQIVLLFLHAIGLAAIARLLALPPILVILPIAAGAIFQFQRALPGLVFSVTCFGPFAFVYAVIAIRFFYIRLLHQTVSGYFAYSLPDWRVPLLALDVATKAAFGYAVLIALALALNSRSRAALCTALTLSIISVSWAGVEYFNSRTFGATGTDPYAYVQMGIDFASHFAATHRFALFQLVSKQTIAWFPIVHAGYHLPFDLQGNAVSVWPSSGAIAYGILYKVVGEHGLYFVNPLFSLASVLMTGLLAWELTTSESIGVRSLTAAGSIAVFATSNEVVNWAGITMVDSQAAFFSMLAVYLGLRARRSSDLGLSVLAGLALGAAYSVRHTQLVLALGIAILLGFADAPLKLRVRNLMAAGMAALLIVLPDLWYHQIYLGGWLHPESEELASYSFNVLPQTLGQLTASLFTGYEFGWVWLFIIIGAVIFARASIVEFVVLATWLLASLALHLPYPALRLRDMLPELPILVFFGVYGTFKSIQIALYFHRPLARLVGATLIFVALDLFILRIWNTIPLVTEPPIPRFGYMTALQRQSIGSLNKLTPPNAIIGASLNSGPIELYAGRSSFRPADWSASDLRIFLETAVRSNLDVFLLEDNSSMATVLTDLRHDYRLTQVDKLDVPLFGDGQIAVPGALWHLQAAVSP